MKTLAILFTLFYFLNALAVAPYGIKGQQQAATLYSNVHLFPNNQVTNTGGINALVESGNSNILENPSFEHLNVSTAWTDNGTATGIGTAVAVIAGKKALAYLPSAQTFNLIQSSTLYASQFADGVQGLAMVRVKSDIALKVCSIKAGTVSTTNCVTTKTDSKWGLYKVPFILGATSNGISISSTGASVTGTVIVDDTFVGAVDLKQDINNIGPWTSFTPTGTWIANTTYVGKYRQVGENLEVAYKVLTSGAPTATTLSLNLPSGFTIDTTKQAVGLNQLVQLNGQATDFSINNYPIIAYTTSTTAVAVQPLNAAGTYTIGGSLISNTIPFTFGASDTVEVTIIVPVTQFSGATSVYSSNNADTDWASCGHTAASFTGFGTVTAIETQCKRQGSDLLMKGKVTSGTPTAVEARVSLPLWNGTQLVSAGTSVIPSLQISGDSSNTFSGATYFRSNTLIEPSVSYFTLGLQTSTQSALAKATGSGLSGVGNSTSFTARIPIEGWNNSNIIIGSFNGLQSCTDSYACVDTFSAQINGSGVVSGENIDWINGNCSVATSEITCTYLTNKLNGNNTALTNGMTCVSVDSISTTVPAATRVYSTLTTGFVASLGAAGRSLNIICQKSGADYIGKTAMAVASDHNLRTPGLTGGSVLFASFAAPATSACVVSNEPSEWVTGNATSAGAGQCSVPMTGWLSTPFCWANHPVSLGNANYCVANATSSTALVVQGVSGSTPTNIACNVFCIGVR